MVLCLTSSTSTSATQTATLVSICKDLNHLLRRVGRPAWRGEANIRCVVNCGPVFFGAIVASGECYSVRSWVSVTLQSLVVCTAAATVGLWSFKSLLDTCQNRCCPSSFAARLTPVIVCWSSPLKGNKSLLLVVCITAKLTFNSVVAKGKEPRRLLSTPYDHLTSVVHIP